MQGQKVVFKQGNDIIPQSDGTIAFAQNILNDTQLQTFSKLIKGFIGKDFMIDLNQIVKNVNSNVVKTRKKNPTKTGFDCPVNTIKIS